MIYREGGGKEGKIPSFRATGPDLECIGGLMETNVASKFTRYWGSQVLESSNFMKHIRRKRRWRRRF